MQKKYLSVYHHITTTFGICSRRKVGGSSHQQRMWVLCHGRMDLIGIDRRVEYILNEWCRNNEIQRDMTWSEPFESITLFFHVVLSWSFVTFNPSIFQLTFICNWFVYCVNTSNCNTDNTLTTGTTVCHLLSHNFCDLTIWNIFPLRQGNYCYLNEIKVEVTKQGRREGSKKKEERKRRKKKKEERMDKPVA